MYKVESKYKWLLSILMMQASRPGFSRIKNKQQNNNEKD